MLCVMRTNMLYAYLEHLLAIRGPKLSWAQFALQLVVSVRKNGWATNRPSQMVLTMGMS